MPIIPIRGVGEIGVIADLLPYDVPINAWNSARNVRFSNRTISRSSVFKLMNSGISYTAQPTSLTDASKPGEQGCLVSVQIDGIFRQLLNGVETGVSPTPAWSPLTSRVTTTKLGGVTYFNNADNKPVYRGSPGAGDFDYLPGWGATESCYSLRAYKDYLIALNVNKGATNYPNMVKWSDATQAGVPPANWDTASLSSHAGENVLNDARGKLVDGMSLGNAFMLYGSQETYRMSFIGTPLIFNFEKVFDDVGVPSVDCVAEVDGRHYVFGNDSIYMHDGMTKVSISDTKVTQRIFRALDVSKKDRCFVYLNKQKSEIVFCYPSTSDDCRWNVDAILGCNEGAVYNYADNTWSFIDLPSVVSVGRASVPSFTTWEDLATWSDLGRSWRSYDGQAPELSVLVSTGNPDLSVGPNLYFYDDFLDGYLSNEAMPATLWEGWVESSVKDTDEFQAGLSTRKLIRSVHPQVSTLDGESTIRVSVGSSESPKGNVYWSSEAEFNPNSDYKCDFRATGRYLLYRFEIPFDSDVEISGYDLDLEVIAQR